MKLIIFLFLSIILFSAHGAHTVHVLSFNVQNLFDLEKDKNGKEDITFLPFALKDNPEHRKTCLERVWEKTHVKSWYQECLTLDWKESNYQLKLQKIAEVIRAVNNGLGPDIIYFQEIENKQVLEDLRTNYLKGLYYQSAYVDEGPLSRDLRGVDIGILTRYPLVKGTQVEYLPTNFNSDIQEELEDTRNLLRLQVVLPTGRAVTLIGVHMPGQHLKVGGHQMRIDQINQIKSYRDEHPEELILVAGDFNISKEEDEKFGMYNLFVPQFLSGASEFCNNCLGTYYFKNVGSMFDNFLFSHNFLDVIENPKMEVYTPILEQKNSSGGPSRFFHESGKGYSDHFPILLSFEIKNSQLPDGLKAQKLLNNFTVKTDKLRLALFDADNTLRINSNGSDRPANSPEEVVLLPGIATKIKQLNDQGYFVGILSNQGGVPKFFSWQQADDSIYEVARLLKEQGVNIDYIDYATDQDYSRKPGPGMMLRLLSFLNVTFPGTTIDLEQSFYVGDAAYTSDEIRPDGRAGFNFSNTDRLFAERIGLTYIEPQVFFGWEKCGTFVINNTSDLSELLDAIYVERCL